MQWKNNANILIGLVNKNNYNQNQLSINNKILYFGKISQIHIIGIYEIEN